MRSMVFIRVLLVLGLGTGLASAGFLPGYPRYKPASISQTTAVVQIRINPTDFPVPMVAGCGVMTDAGPFPAVPPDPSEILSWQYHSPGRVLFAISANISDPNDMLELTVMVVPSEHAERDFELFCALNTMDAAADVASTHLHLQLLSMDGSFPVYLLPNDLYNYRNPGAFFSFEGDTFGSTIVMKSNTTAPRLGLFDVPLRTVHQEEVSFSVSIFQTTISSQVFVGFTDGTTVWGAAVSDRSCEFVMLDYTNPLAYAVGSSLNQFNIFNFVDNSDRFNVSFTMSRRTRVVSASFRRGSASVTRTPTEDPQRSRFPAGPLRLVLFSLAATSTFRFYSINATITCSDDSVITTTVTDLYAVDIINQLDASVSAGYTVTDTAAVVFSGTTRFQRLLSLPLGYVAKLTDTFALTVTYRGVSSLTPANDVLIGVTNNTQSWLGARYSNIQQGYLGNFSSPTSKISNTPFAVGVAQPVSIDYGVPFDVELYTKACASCTSAGNLTGVVRTWNGWVTWQVPITSFPVVGPLSLLTLKPTSTPSTDSVSFVRLQLSANDQYPPSVVLFSRTKFLRCNHTEVFIAVFSEPVANVTGSSLVLDNAEVSDAPYPVDPDFPIEWRFHIQPLDDGYFSVAVAADSFQDLNGWSNPAGSDSLWYLYDSVLPVVVSIVPSIPIQPFINDVTMNSTVFTVTFGEAPFTAFTASRIECVNCVAKDVLELSPSVYTFRVTVIQDSLYTAAAITDDAGNGNLPTPWISWLYDGIFPTAVISAPLPQFVNRTVAQSTRFIVTFSKIVVGFDATKISVTNGYATNVRQLSATPIQFDFLVVMHSDFHDGIVNVSIPAAAVTDRALNPSIATWFWFTFDDTFPTVTLSSSQRFPTNSSSIRFVASFTEAMVAVNNSNFLISAGYANQSTLIANSSYRLGPFVVAFDVIPTAQGIISVSVPANNVTDLGYNPNLASTCGVLPGPCSFLFDSVRPTATITTSTLAITNTLLPYNVTFSEPVQYFNASNINVYGGVPTNVRKSFGNSYLFDILPNVTDGVIFVNLSAFATVDIAFNGLIRTSTVARHYDVVRPFATILSDMPAEVSQYTNVPFLIQFSEYIQEDAFVEDFGTRNINLTVFELVAPANATSGPVYKLFMRPIYDDCDMGLYMPPNIYHDRAGNGNRDLYYGIHYQLSYNPGWPLWAKIVVVLGPLTCCVSSIAISCYCWLRLPPLKKIPDEEVEPFDAAKAIADMKAAAAAEEEKLRRVRLGLEPNPVEEVKVLLDSPLPPTITPRTGGFAVQLMGKRKSEVDRYTPQPPLSYTTASPQLEFDTPSPFRSASPGTVTLGRKKSSFRTDVVFPAEDFHDGGSRLNLVTSPLAWQEQKASPSHVTLVSPGKKKSYYPASRTGVL